MDRKIINTFSNKFIIPTAAWVFLGLLFIYGGAIHVLSPLKMLQAIEGYQFLSPPLALVGAYYIPWIELCAGVAVLFSHFRAAAALVITGLMTAFIIGTASAAWRGIELHCGCFGIQPGAQPDSYPVLFIRHFALLFLCGYVFYKAHKRN